VQYGRCIAYPDFASLPYTEYAGQEQYLYQLLCLGAGRYDIEAIRIEDTPIDSFEEITYEVIEPGGSVTLFPTAVVTVLEVAGQELLDPDYIGPFVANAAGTQANALAFDVVAPRGVYYVNASGVLENQSITVKFEARTIDDEGTATGSWVVLGTETITAKTTTPQRHSFRYDVTAARYEIRVTRTDTKNTGSTYGHEIVWSGARVYLPETRDFGEVTLIALRMRASNNLTELASRKINVISTRRLNWCTPGTYVWNGFTFVWDPNGWNCGNGGPTSAIAHALYDVLWNQTYGAGLPNGILFGTTSRIDLLGLHQLHQIWMARGDEFNGRFDSTMTVWEVLTKIAAAGRAKPYMQGGVVRFVRDGLQTDPVALFSMRNIIKGSFNLDYLLPTNETADSIEATYWDKLVWAPRKVLATLPGSTTNKPAKIDLFGVTDREQAYREAIYQAASNRYRRKIIRFQTEMEGFIPSLGDLIAIQHDMPAWGQHAEVVSTEQAENLLKWSEDLRPTIDGGPTGSPWGTFVGTDTYCERFDINDPNVGSIVETMPGRAPYVTKLACETTGAVQRQVSQSLPSWVPDDTVVCHSVYAKAGEVNVLRLYVATRVPDYPNVRFNLATGTMEGAPADSYWDMEEVPGAEGWYRCWLASSIKSGGASGAIVLQLNADGGGAYDGAIGDGLYLHGAQTEIGTAPSPYVKTEAEPRTVTIINLTDAMQFNPDDTSQHYIGIRNKAGGFAGPLPVDWAGEKAVAYNGETFGAFYTGNDYERTHIVFGWGETYRMRAKVINIKPISLHQVEIEAINEDDSVHTADTGIVAPPVQYSQLSVLNTSPRVANLVMRSSSGDSSKALLTWTPAPGATIYHIEMASGTDRYDTVLAWTRVGETSASSYAVTALYGAQTLIRVRGVGLTAGPWTTMLFGESADYMWSATSSDLMWNAVNTTLMWRY
jgi:hypothetical protein